MRSVLVLRGGALGDFIVTLPALAALRKRWPDARIDLAGNPVAAALAVNRGLLDRVHSQHESRWGALFRPGPLSDDFDRFLRSFDLVVNYWPDPDGDLARRFPITTTQRFTTHPAAPACAPAARHYLDALAPWGATFDTDWLPLAPLQPKPASDVVVIHPGSGSPRKNWPAERWEELIALLPAPVLLVVGEAERERWTSSRLAGGAARGRLADGSLRFATDLPLEELLATLASARLFIGHDSGVSHLAAASGTRSILLFAPTDPAVWAPPAPGVTVIRRAGALDAIPVDEVLHTAVAGLRPA